MAARLNQLGVPAQYFDSWTLGLRTTGEFGNAQVDTSCYDALKSNIKKLDESMCVEPRRLPGPKCGPSLSHMQPCVCGGAGWRWSRASSGTTSTDASRRWAAVART